MVRAYWVALLIPVLAVAVLGTVGVRPAVAGPEHAEYAEIAEPVAQAAHSHEDDHGDEGESGLLRLTAWLGAFHPAAVHFPIALLPAALLAELIAVMRKSEKLAAAGRYCLVLGALSAVLAAALGWFWEGFELTHSRLMMTQHQWAGTGTAVLCIGLLILCPLSARPGARVTRRLYLMLLVVTAALVVVTGFLGGALVWGTDHLSW
jgi:uncharacterized membrane protein